MLFEFFYILVPKKIDVDAHKMETMITPNTVSNYQNN